MDDLFGGSRTAFDAHEPSVLLRGRTYVDGGAWFEMGAWDALAREPAVTLAPLARAAGRPTCVVVVPRYGQVGEVWRRAFRDSLPWLAARTGLTDEPPRCPSG